MASGPTKNIKLAAATLNQTPLDWKNNLENIKLAIRKAREESVNVLLLPELCLCGYGCEDWFLADWVQEKSLQKMLELLPFTENIAVSIGLPILWNQELYNCACLIHDGEIKGFSAKQHLANDGVHYEHRWFQSWGRRGLESISIEGKEYPFGEVIYDLSGFKFIYEICEDMWHEGKRPASYLQTNIHFILNPSASPFTFGKTKRRERIILDTTIKYNCVYVYANLLGNESGRIIFDGELFIASEGKVRAQNSRFSFANFNLISQDFFSVDGRLVASDKGYVPVSETKEQEFCKAAALGLFDYLRKSSSKCFVLSLSGGADSTCCAALVRLMVDLSIKELGISGFNRKLGLQIPDESSAMAYLLHCAYQGTVNSSEDTYLSAKEVAEELGASFYNWKVDSAVNEFTSTIEDATGTKLSWQVHDVALQNIQARARAPFIWFLANLKQGLLITTSNRSEGDVGYCTMDGDTAGGIAPISGVDKPFVQHWLHWAEKEFNWKSLRHVNNLSPSAELRPLETKQTDEADLMPYALLLQIEQLAVHQKKSPRNVWEALVHKKEYSAEDLKKHIVRFFRLWQQSQWKRERLAPGFYLDEFNVDPKTWCRFPILGGGFEEELNW